MLLSSFCSLIILPLMLLSGHAESKPRCEALLLKLEHIQALQRRGYTVKQGHALTRRENKARDKWWQCERSISTGRKVKKTFKKTNSKLMIKKQVSRESNKLLTRKIKRFNQGSAIIIKAKYQGEQRKAWLKFYQQPKQCNQPKTLSVFAYCSENKLQQQAKFEREFY
jgi:hypothetical protein